MSAIHDIERRIGSLPRLPEAAQKLLTLLRRPDASVPAIERVVRTDVALAADLLRLANSAMFRGRQETSSLRAAVMRLGLRRIGDLALTAGFRRLMPRELPGYGIEAKAFWLHCMSVAVMAEALAKKLGLPTSEGYYSAGLLHDVGKLVTGMVLEESGVIERLAACEDEALVDVELHELGLDHTEVGFRVATAWRLPDSLAAAIRWHHSPDQVPDAERQQLVDIVHVADALAHSFGLGSDVGGLRRGLAQKAVERLGLSWAALAETAAMTLDTALQAGDTLGISG